MYGRFGTGGDFDASAAYAATPSQRASAALAAAGMKLSDFFAAVGAMRMLPPRPSWLRLKGDKAPEPKAFSARIPPSTLPAAPPAEAPIPPVAFAAVTPDGTPVTEGIGDVGNPVQYPPSIAGPDVPGGGGPFVVRPPTTAVPEPATWLLMIGGFGIVGWQMRRRHRSAAATLAPRPGKY